MLPAGRQVAEEPPHSDGEALAWPADGVRRRAAGVGSDAPLPFLTSPQQRPAEAAAAGPPPAELVGAGLLRTPGLSDPSVAVVYEINDLTKYIVRVRPRPAEPVPPNLEGGRQGDSRTRTFTWTEQDPEKPTVVTTKVVSTTTTTTTTTTTKVANDENDRDASKSVEVVPAEAPAAVSITAAISEAATAADAAADAVVAERRSLAVHERAESPEVGSKRSRSLSTSPPASSTGKPALKSFKPTLSPEGLSSEEDLLATNHIPVATLAKLRPMRNAAGNWEEWVLALGARDRNKLARARMIPDLDLEDLRRVARRRQWAAASRKYKSAKK